MVGTSEWQLRGWLGDEWRWHVNKPWDMPGWLPAHVPGSVVDDLVRAGELPTPYFERNSRLAEWASARTWVYRTRVAGVQTLEFQGVDYACEVFVDGEPVAGHVGPFTPFRVEIPAGAHLLAVAVHAAPESEAQVGRTSRVRVHKPRMNYGWDFCPRLVHQGIWRPVGAPRSYPRVSFDGAVGRVELDGEVLLEVEQPELWWPNGAGEQRLYRAGDWEVGFRTIELVANEGAPADALPYTLVVNGERVFMRGWNWVPIDVNYGVPQPEKLERLLRLVQQANVNVLRVWGGGVIESDEFYAWCDRLGILVWQEFSQSSSGLESTPSDDPDFVAALAADARQIVPSRAHHPSLFAWCGGNELAWPDGEPIDERSPAIAALGDVVRELDPARVWLATSPTGPKGTWDMHGPWEHQGLRKHYEHYDSRTNLIHSEFGVEGMTNRDALDALIAPAHRWPADRSNPVYEHLGAWWNNAPLVQEAFGGRIADVETMRRASQWLQYEGLRYAVEATIRRAWRASGVLPWQFNESFPNAWCTSAVDWHGNPKPVYFGVARAYRGAPSAQFATCAWGGLGEVRATVRSPARLVDLDGRVVAEASEGEIAAPLDAFAHDVFLLDLVTNRYVLSRTENLAPLLDLPPATLSLAGGVLRNTGAVAALGVVTDGDVLDLLPGEERELDGERAEGWNARL
ncbi:MAG TPA: glycoside hydrolase family 2 TIM barrel-domain containing protein [Gaiellaceae bacterium]